MDDACMVGMYAPDEKRSENFMISDLDPDTRNNPSSINALTKKNNNKCERKGREKKKVKVIRRILRTPHSVLGIFVASEDGNAR